MRIEAYTQIQQLYSASQVQKGKSVAKKGPSDQVQISSAGLDYQVGSAAVKGAADIRMDVVGPIKKAISEGTYAVSGESFAEKLMSKYEELQ